MFCDYGPAHADACSYIDARPDQDYPTTSDGYFDATAISHTPSFSHLRARPGAGFGIS
jgi:hypothetical protein